MSPNSRLPAKVGPRASSLPTEPVRELPRILEGHGSPAVRKRVEGFVASVAAMFETWVARRENPHTQRAYRQDVMHFVRFVGINWPNEDWKLLQCAVPDVQEWRNFMVKTEGRAPKTVLRRVTSLSRFFEYMREQAAEFRLPIIVPNPAHKNHIPREDAEAVTPTKELTFSRVRQLKELAAGETVLAYRDRAIIFFYLYTGARIGTGCSVRVEDCHLDPENPYVMVQEKGKGASKRRIGINSQCAEALAEFIEQAALGSGPLFRPRLNPRSEKLATRAMTPVTMYRLLQSYLERLPRASREVELPDGTKVRRCIYTPHSLRATTATQADEAGVPITAIQELLGHKQVKTTQVYVKRKRGTKESASHQLPF